MNKKIIFTILLSFIFTSLFSISSICSYAQSNKIVKEYKFKSIGDNFSSHKKPKEVIYIKGEKYKLDEIKYEVLSEKPLYEKEIPFKNLLKKEVPKEMTYKENSDSPEIKLFLKDVKYDEIKRKKCNGYADFEDVNAKIPETKELSYKDADGKIKKTVGHLTHTQKIKGSDFTLPFNVSAKFYGDMDVNYYMINNIKIPKNEESPVFLGYEKIVLDYLGLNQANYKITKGRWESGYELEKETNKTVRYASFSGLKKGYMIRAFYEEDDAGIYEFVRYNANAFYESGDDLKEYEVLAKCTYKNIPKLEKEKAGIVQAVLKICVALFILCMLAVTILMIIKKKKEREK